MSDTLRIETDYCGFTAYYDPEGPIGRGKTREEALVDLLESCDNLHRTTLLAGSIVALMPTKVMDSGDAAGRLLAAFRRYDDAHEVAAIGTDDYEAERIGFDEIDRLTVAECEAMGALRDAADEFEKSRPSEPPSQELSRRKCCTDPACPVRND